MSDINVEMAAYDEWVRWSCDLSYVGFSEPQREPPGQECFTAGFAAGVELAEHQEHWGQDVNCYWCVKEHPELADRGSDVRQDAAGRGGAGPVPEGGGPARPGGRYSPKRSG